MKRILCFGDSLTWGYRAASDGGVPTRYDTDTRWTGLLADDLKSEACVIEDGLCGRTANVDDPIAPYRNGADALPMALRSHTPLDLVVMMLGTNDSQCYYNRSALEIAVGIGALARLIVGFSGPEAMYYPPPKLLLLCPPPVTTDPETWIGKEFEGGNDRLAAMPALLAALCESLGAAFLDVGQVLTTEGADGVHFSGANNRALAETVAEEARRILG